MYDAGGKLVAEYSTVLAATQRVSYLTADHLGSPRIITNEVGAVVKRQDYGAFGDEPVTSERTNRTDYTPPTPDEIRQDYTGYQKDDESGLEFAQARYYNTQHGRFTSVDPLTASATIKDPQSFNRYSYVLNSPYKLSDPLGLLPWCSMCQADNDDVGFAENTGSSASGEDGSRQPSAPHSAAPPPRGSEELNKNLERVRKMYAPFTDTEQQQVAAGIARIRSLAIQDGEPTQFYYDLLKTFRKTEKGKMAGDSLDLIAFLDSLQSSGGFGIVSTKTGWKLKTFQNIFNGEKSEVMINDLKTGRLTPAYQFFRDNRTVGGFVDGQGNIFLGPLFFANSQSADDQAKIIIHETIVHKGLRRLDTDFDQPTDKGSLRINELLNKIYPKSKL